MQLETISTEKKSRPAHLFGPGNNANPKGRPKGSRNKLSEDFIGDLHVAWKEKGPRAIERMAEEDPGAFVKVVAGILPQKIEITSRFASLSEEEIDRAILRATAELTVIGQDRMAGDGGGSREAEGSAEAVSVSALSEAEAIP